MPLDPKDAIIQKLCPVVIAPLYGQLDHLTTDGHRFLVANDGLWVEVRRPWLHAILPISDEPRMALPYGNLAKKITFTFGKLPIELLKKFIDDAREVCPIECAAWLVWDQEQKELVYRKLSTIEGTRTYLELERPMLADRESLAVELHSHGIDRAYFSEDDDKDDAGAYVISGIVGNVFSDKPSSTFRLCVGGMFVNLNADSSRLWD